MEEAVQHLLYLKWMKRVVDSELVLCSNMQACRHPRTEEGQHILAVAAPWGAMAHEEEVGEEQNLLLPVD